MNDAQYAEYLKPVTRMLDALSCCTQVCEDTGKVASGLLMVFDDEDYGPRHEDLVAALDDLIAGDAWSDGQREWGKDLKTAIEELSE